MVDVVVDQKPLAKLPYDPDMIPAAVKKRAAEVDALYAQNGSKPDNAVPEPEPSPVEAPSPQAPDAAREADQPVPAAPSAPADQMQQPAEAPPPSEDDWKRRFVRMQGRYESAQKTIGEMQEQMTQLGNELLQVQRRPPQWEQQPPPYQPAAAPSYLTEQDVQNYGTDLVDFTQRAAAQAITPHLQQIERQNAELQRRLGDEARKRLDQAVELALPDFREIDRNPRWHRWLLGVDVLSGRVRQQLLDEAIAAAQAPRVISFFRGFLQEEVATGHSEPAPYSPQAAPPREPAVPLASLASPGRARPATGGDASVPPDKPTYTRAQIAQLYEQHRKGAYLGREAEWARREADFFAAQREGRVR